MPQDGLNKRNTACLPVQGIFNDDAFAKMKRGARLVNVARGGVVDDASLVRALDAGIVAQVSASEHAGPLIIMASGKTTMLARTCHRPS